MKKITLIVLTLFFSLCATAQSDTFVPTEEELAKYLPLLNIGEEAPELCAKDINGTVINIRDFRGSYVVIDFWATWCGDCRREIPGLKALYDATKDKTIDGAGIKWIGFSFDFNAEAWQNMIEKEQLAWPQISNLKKTREDPTFNNWKLRWIPAFFVLGPDGKIIGKAITADGLAEVLKAL